MGGEVGYLSPQGDDARTGNSPCNLRPGQTLYILPGVYRESVILGAFGDRHAPITIQGVEVEGRRPVLDGENIRTMGIALIESVNITIQGLEFRNYTDEGVYVLNGHGITLRNNRFLYNGRASADPDMDGEGFGLAVIGGRDVLIEDNEVAFNGPNQERWEKHVLGMGDQYLGSRTTSRWISGVWNGSAVRGSLVSEHLKFGSVEQRAYV